MYANFYIGANAPTDPIDMGRVWIRTDLNGGIKGIYKYTALTLWCRTHPLPPGFVTILPAGLALADIDTFDGGLAGAVGYCSGPMWEVDTRFAGRVPIGVGTLQPSTTVLALDAIGGADQFALDPFLVQHFHGTGDHNFLSTNILRTWAMGAYSQISWFANTTGLYPAQNIANGDAGTSNAIPDPANPSNSITIRTMPPYKVVYYIQRTARIAYESNSD
jgi:hypothetical protein